MLAVVAAAFLPWLSHSGKSIGGLQRDGKLILVVGLLGILFGLLVLVIDSRWPFAPLALLGIVVTALAVTDILDVTGTAGLTISSVGIGLFMGTAAGIVAVVSGAGGLSLRDDGFVQRQALVSQAGTGAIASGQGNLP